MSLCETCKNSNICQQFTMSSGNLTWCTPLFKGDNSDWAIQALEEASNQLAIDYEPSVCNSYEESIFAKAARLESSK